MKAPLSKLKWVGFFSGLVTLGLCVAFYAGAYAFVAKNRPGWMALLFWGIFLWWQLFPIFVAGFGTNFEFATLLRFPLSLQAFYLLGLGYGLSDYAALSGVCWVFSMIAGAGTAWGGSGPMGPGYTYCGLIHTRSTSNGQPVRVYARRASCQTAMTIQRAVWTGPPSQRQVHQGASEATSYMLLRHHPGWVCRPGLGAEICRNRTMTAAGLF